MVVQLASGMLEPLAVFSGILPALVIDPGTLFILQKGCCQESAVCNKGRSQTLLV